MTEEIVALKVDHNITEEDAASIRESWSAWLEDRSKPLILGPGVRLVTPRSDTEELTDPQIREAGDPTLQHLDRIGDALWTIAIILGVAVGLLVYGLAR
jgi:hypothetical protein